MGTVIIDGQPYEIRRLIDLGGSLAVTLPYNWTLEQGASKGDAVIIENSDGKLIIKKVELSIREADSDKA